MDILKIIIVFIYAYLVGSIPFGLILTRLLTGQDIRILGSGRTGGTNAGRIGGLWVGVFTTLLDGLKAASAVWLSRYLVDSAWIDVIAPLLSIVGHNYSIFLIQRDNQGKISLKGGAGGAACAGGSVGLWPFSFFIIVPIAALLLYTIGYASITTISMALISIIIFSIRAVLGYSPWQYILYGLLSEILLLWALRPNIKRLLEGNERLVGRRARNKNKDTVNPSS
jgi:glycerol-3-phosphate acyltransferase PlsY